MKKKLLLIASKSLTVNTFLDQLIIDLKKNFETKVLVSDPKNINLNCQKKKIELDLNWVDFLNLFKIMKSLLAIRSLLAKNKDSEIFVHTPLAAHMIRLALIFTNKKIIYFVHGFRFHKKTNIIKYFFFSTIEYFLKIKTKYYFVINQEDKIYVKKVLKKKCYLVHGIGIKLKKNKIKINKNKSKLIVGVVAAYRKNKGYDNLISIVNKLKKENILFLCFGYGDKGKYFDKIIKLGIEKKIKFFSFKKNLVKYFNKFDLLLHCSFREGLPISVLQSLYFGVPVIGRDIRGVNDLIINNKYGYLIKNDFINNAVKLIKFLNSNRKKINIFKKKINQIKFKKYSKQIISKTIIKKLIQNYEI